MIFRRTSALHLRGRTAALPPEESASVPPPSPAWCLQARWGRQDNERLSLRRRTTRTGLDAVRRGRTPSLGAASAGSPSAGLPPVPGAAAPVAEHHADRGLRTARWRSSGMGVPGYDGVRLGDFEPTSQQTGEWLPSRDSGRYQRYRCRFHFVYGSKLRRPSENITLRSAFTRQYRTIPSV